MSEIKNRLDGIKSSTNITEIKTIVPGNTAVEIIQSKDRKKKVFFLTERWVLCEKIPNGLTEIEIPQKERREDRKILEEIMAKLFNKNYKFIDQRTWDT